MPEGLSSVGLRLCLKKHWFVLALRHISPLHLKESFVNKNIWKFEIDWKKHTGHRMDCYLSH